MNPSWTGVYTYRGDFFFLWSGEEGTKPSCGNSSVNHPYFSAEYDYKIYADSPRFCIPVELLR